MRWFGLWSSSHLGEGVNYEKEHFRTWDPEHGVRMLSVPQGTNDETDSLDKLDCINDTTIGVARSNLRDRVVDYFIADISTLKAS